MLPKPVAVCRYWHRSLNPKKLVEVGFSSLAPRMTLARTIKLYKLPSTPATPGLRPMRESDAPAVAALLNAYLAKFKLAQKFTPEEAAHWLTPRELVVDTWVVDAAPAGGSVGGGGGGGSAAAANGGASSSSGNGGGSGGADGSGADGSGGSGGSGAGGSGGGGGSVTDVVSFYTLPSSVLGHPEHKEIRAAYMFYTGDGGWFWGGGRGEMRWWWVEDEG